MSNARRFWNWFLRGAASAPAKPAQRDATSISSKAGLPSTFETVTPLVPQVALEVAVDEFNRRAASDELGKSQPVLTVDEITTVIRSAGRHQLPLYEHQRRQLQAIAETQLLPADAQLKFTTSWFAPSGYHCEVWWIDLVLSGPAQSAESHHGESPASDSHAPSTCSLRIRDHRLRSWHDTSVTVPTEILRLQADHRWFPAAPPRPEVPAHS